MNDDRPKLLGVFPSQFPGWTPPEERNADGMFTRPDGAFSISIRFSPVGVSAIDVNGHLWVLVHDYAEKDDQKARKWVRFPVEFVR